MKKGDPRVADLRGIEDEAIQRILGNHPSIRRDGIFVEDDLHHQIDIPFRQSCRQSHDDFNQRAFGGHSRLQRDQHTDHTRAPRHQLLRGAIGAIVHALGGLLNEFTGFF